MIIIIVVNKITVIICLVNKPVFSNGLVLKFLGISCTFIVRYILHLIDVFRLCELKSLEYAWMDMHGLRTARSKSFDFMAENYETNLNMQSLEFGLPTTRARSKCFGIINPKQR